jgi:hypothetical protein
LAVTQQVSTQIRKKVVKTSWLLMPNGNTGNPETFGRYTGRLSVQVFGTFGAAGSVQIEGSNDGGTTWVILFDNRGTGAAMTFTAAGLRSLNDVPALIRPNVTAGDGTTSLNVIVTGTL